MFLPVLQSCCNHPVGSHTLQVSYAARRQCPRCHTKTKGSCIFSELPSDAPALVLIGSVCIKSSPFFTAEFVLSGTIVFESEFDDLGRQALFWMICLIRLGFQYWLWLYRLRTVGSGSLRPSALSSLILPGASSPPLCSEAYSAPLCSFFRLFVSVFHHQSDHERKRCPKET